MTQPITQAQLDSLERAADKVFGKLGIDIEFTRHFLDRVNDERNQKQITLRELGELFVKEYKRWGRKIANMPINTQAVMKDLSTELNIPFVLNKDGDETDLVAKTVMRKKDFKTSNPELPVESVSEDSPCWDGYEKVPGKRDYEKGSCRKKTTKEGAIMSAVREEKHGAKKGTQVKGKDKTPAMTKPSRTGSQPHPMRGKLVGEGANDKAAYIQARFGKQEAVQEDEFDIDFFIQQVMWEHYSLNEAILPRADAILLAALKYIDKLMADDNDAQAHGVASAAFQTSRAFDVGKTGRELQRLYQQWKETGELPNATE